MPLKPPHSKNRAGRFAEEPLARGLVTLKEHESCVLLWTGRVTPQEHFSYLFSDPLEMVSCYHSSELQGCFQRLEGSLRAGYWLAGFITYEAGLAFEEVLTPRELEGFPLLWFGAYREPLMLDHSKPGSLTWSETAKPQEENTFLSGDKGYSVANLRMSVGREEYIQDIHTIREYIAQGHTYQVNYTFKCKFSLAGSPYLLFMDLNRKQSVSYAAFIKFGSRRVLSLSPELFLRKEGARGWSSL